MAIPLCCWAPAMEAAANAKVERKTKRVIVSIEALDCSYRCWGWLGRLDSWSWGEEDIYIYGDMKSNTMTHDISLRLENCS